MHITPEMDTALYWQNEKKTIGLSSANSVYLSDVVLATSYTNILNVCSFAACPTGQWGADCLKLCNCKTPETTCDPTTGCGACRCGFTGGECSTDVNECDNKPCDSDGTCINTHGTFKCKCNDGYTQSSPTTCKGR